VQEGKAIRKGRNMKEKGEEKEVDEMRELGGKYIMHR
jgi:hypothetical protein